MSSTELQSSDVLESGEPDLPAEVFDVPVNIPLIHQVVVAQQAAARQGTSATRTRGQVRGGGKKPYRQKGTGRARQGSTRAPQFVGGGVVHGPVPRNYAQRTPKKMKAAALRSALSDRARAGRIHVIGTLVESDRPSTKGAMAALTQVAAGAHTLVVLPRGDELGWRSLRNVPEVHLLWADQLNTYDVLVSDDVVFTRAALQAFLDLVAGPPARGSEAADIDAAPTAIDDTSGPAADAQHTEADTVADTEADTVADGIGAIREEGNE